MMFVINSNPENNIDVNDNIDDNYYKKNNEIKNSSLTINENRSRLVNFEGLSGNLVLIEVKTNRGLRFLYSFFLLIASSIICFLIVKSTVDWATYYKLELNKYNETRNKYISDQINEKFKFLKRNE